MIKEEKKASKHRGVNFNSERKFWVVAGWCDGCIRYLGGSKEYDKARIIAWRNDLRNRKLRGGVVSLSGEIWKNISGGDGIYQVSNMGRVLSFRGRPKLLKPGRCSKGGRYRLVALSLNGITIRPYVHRLVAEHFISNPNNHPQINHKDSNPANNHVDNLEWCTCKQNINHAIGKGRMLVGNKNGNNVLSEVQVLDIKQRLASGSWGIGVRLAREYGVSTNTIWAINTGKTWSWL